MPAPSVPHPRSDPDGPHSDPHRAQGHDRRVDPHTGTVVHVVGARQGRPNLPGDGCPFCVGGREAPDPYEVRWFPNRWPAMPGDRCEVVLYTPDHDATFWSLGAQGARRVIDLWAERTATLGARPDVEYVLVFENRGAEVGATIHHPHGQVYAYDHVPAGPARRLAAGWRPERDPGGRRVLDGDGWRAWVPLAPRYPVEVVLAPVRRIADLPSMPGPERDTLAVALVDVLARLDALHDRPLPYMLWLEQRPTGHAGRAGPTGAAPGADLAWFHVVIASPWRAAGVPRFIAAAEVAGEEYFNPVVPEDLAARLRTARPR